MTNNSIVVYGPMDIRYEDHGIRKPGPGEVLIKLKSEGICATDMEILTQELIYYTSNMAHLPIVPGHEWSGEVVELGENVKNFSVGDKVTGECSISCGHCEYCQNGLYALCPERTETGVMNRDGGYAEYITYPASSLHKFTKLSFDQGAVIEPACVSTEAVLRGRVSPKDTVLVIGPGPIGLLAAQVAKKVYGAKKVFISGTRDERLERAKEYTDAQINVKKEDIAARIKELTGGKGVNVIIESAGAIDSFEVAQKVLAPAGRIVTCGFFGNKPVACNWDFITTTDAEIIGSLASPGVWDFVIDCIESGKIDIDNVISHRLPLESKEDFMNALDIMTQKKENVCKIVMKQKEVDL